MRILFVNTIFYPTPGGGAEVILRSQARLLQSIGHEVAIATLGSEPGIQEEEVDGLKIYRCGHHNIYFHQRGIAHPAWKRLIWHALDRSNPFTPRSLAEVTRRFRPDVAWCHNLTGWSVTAWKALKREGVPIVQVLHDQYMLCANSNMYKAGANCEKPCGVCAILRRGHPRASRDVATVVGVSQFILRKVTSSGNFPDARKEILYNVKDGGLPALKPRNSSELDRTFGYIGVLIENKGVEHLLKTFSDLDHPRTRLLLAGVGEPGYVQKLKEKFASPKIQFLGHVPAASFFEGIDVCIVPSLWQDTLPTVVFEAHAHGVPVLGSNRGGIPEMIHSGRNGWIFEPLAKGELEKWLSRLSTDILPDPEAVRQSARQFFDTDPWVGNFMRISTEAIDRKSPNARSSGRNCADSDE